MPTLAEAPTLAFPSEHIRLRRFPTRQVFFLILIPVLFVLAWQAVVGGIVPGLHPLDPVLVGRPDRVAAQLRTLVISGTLWPHVRATLGEAVVGLLLASVTGITAGIVIAGRQETAAITLPYINILNSIPKLALAPLFLIWFGIGVASKVAVSAAAAFFPLFYTTYEGVRGIDQDLLNALKVMGANRLAVLRLVTLPSVLTWTVAGLRTSLGLAIVGAVVGEYLGSTHGLGYLLIAAQGSLNTDRAWAVLVILGAIGAVLDGLARLLETRLLRWRTVNEA